MLLPSERDLPENTSRRRIWLPCLQREWQEELGEFTGPYAGCYNPIGWRAYWKNQDLDAVLREHGYVHAARHPIPPDRQGTHSAPTQARSATRSLSSDGCSAARSASYPPPARQSTAT
jgi:hypothetical protein